MQAIALSSYLDIAEEVLRRHRRPMGPRAILRHAYLLDLVDPHLHGTTQHKTVQARLSEDILERRERSRFYRTEPGRFFLREFLTDPEIPAEFRTPMTARRRRRELTQAPVLCVARDSLNDLTGTIRDCRLERLSTLLDEGKLSYFEAKRPPLDYLTIWCFVIFARADDVLTYRVGRYRAPEETFASKRTVGFTSLVTEDQHTLFNRDSLGIVEAGLTALALDLDFPLGIETLEGEVSTEMSLIPVMRDEEPVAALAVFETMCPEWFEPTTRRLSMNHLTWLPFRAPPNQIDDYDPWSRAVMHHRFAHAG